MVQCLSKIKKNIKISRILHAGYIFESGQTQIIFDPIFENPFSQNCYAFPNVEFDCDQIRKLKPHAIFISHFHDDHCSLESLNFLDRRTPIYMYCLFEEIFVLIKELGFMNVHSIKIGIPMIIGDFEITAHPALDANVDSIFQIKADGFNILNVVDSWIDTSTLNALADCASWDIILWPFQTMREIEVISPKHSLPASQKLPHEWIDQLRILKPKYIVPSSCQFIQESWSWYNHALFPISYKIFKHEIESTLPESKVIRMNPSTSITLEQGSLSVASRLSWINLIGDENIDYEYRSDLKPPSTAEIAKNFTALTEQQTQDIYTYCQSELLQKYILLEIPEEIYFQGSRKWKLSIYNHFGEVKNFYYQIESNDIKIIEGDDKFLSWTTEIPIFKLHAALHQGEALTSLYIRINDFIFEPNIEKEIAEVDPVQDPLIRCLFNGQFGSYQRAQLIKINSNLQQTVP